MVEANEHIALGGDVHKLGVRLVVERHKLQFAVRALHGLLTVLRVVLQAAVSELISLVVLIHEVLRAVEVEVLRTEARVEREKDFLCNVHGVRRGDGFRQFHVVAVFGRDSTCGDFVLRDSVEAVEKVFGCVAGGVTHTIPDSIVEMLGKTFRDEREHVLSRRR